jgi:DNA adenine methylase
MTRTPISYYGGKIKMVSTILPLIPKHRIYTEAFFGGGAIFFAKKPSESEVINDINNMVVNFYKVAQNDFEKLKTKVRATPFSRAAYTVAWAIYRMPHLFNELQQAWAFYVATNMGFACKIGSWGYDKYGKRMKAFRNRKMRFDETIKERLGSVQIESNDAITVINSYDAPDAFHYVDPPYFNSDMGHYNSYTEQDYITLLNTLAGIKGKFLLSSYPSNILDTYIKNYGWHTKRITKTLSAPRGTAGQTRKKKIEVLTANYPL